MVLMSLTNTVPLPRMAPRLFDVAASYSAAVLAWYIHTREVCVPSHAISPPELNLIVVLQEMETMRVVD